MPCTLSKPKSKPGCTLTKGIPCALSKPMIPSCITVKQMLNQCKLTKPYCKPIVKMKSLPCPAKPACKPSVLVNYNICATSIKPKCKPYVNVKHVDSDPNRDQNSLCTTIKQKINIIDVSRLNKPKICTGAKPKPVCYSKPKLNPLCYSKPNAPCSLAIPKCSSVMKPTKVKKNKRDL